MGTFIEGGPTAETNPDEGYGIKIILDCGLGIYLQKQEEVKQRRVAQHILLQHLNLSSHLNHHHSHFLTLKMVMFPNIINVNSQKFLN